MLKNRLSVSQVTTQKCVQ